MGFGYGVEAPAPVVNERRDGTPARTNPSGSKTLISQVLQWLSGAGVGLVAFWNAQSQEVQLAIVAGFVVSAIAGGIVFRERLRKWADGDR